MSNPPLPAGWSKVAWELVSSVLNGEEYTPPSINGFYLTGAQVSAYNGLVASGYKFENLVSELGTIGRFSVTLPTGSGIISLADHPGRFIDYIWSIDGPRREMQKAVDSATAAANNARAAMFRIDAILRQGLARPVSTDGLAAEMLSMTMDSLAALAVICEFVALNVFPFTKKECDS